MKRVNLLLILFMLASSSVLAQETTPYHVIDTTMVFSEDDFEVVTNRRGLNSIQHINYLDDPSFSFVDHDLEKARLMWWSPIFTLHKDERIATTDCVSYELGDEILFMEHPQLGGKSTTKPFDEDAPTSACYAYYTTVPNGKPVRLLTELAALSDEIDYLYAVQYPLVKVCPFRYDSVEDKLYLYKKVRLKICLAERQMNKYVQEGTVRDQDGNPIPNALLTLADTLQYHTDADGHYKITIETWSSDTSGKLWVTADNYTASKSYVVAQFPISVINLSETIDFQIYNALNFKAGQLCTIILPVEPDATMGRYFRLDRVEDGNIVFERVFSPKAYYPYILIPDKDARLELAGMDLRRDTTVWVTTNNNEAGFYGAFCSSGYAFPRSFKYYPLEASSTYAGYVEAMHATLYYPYMENWGLILHDPDSDVDAIYDLRGNQIVNRKSENSTCYDLSGRRVSVPSVLPRGVYIRDGKKFVVR